MGKNAITIGAILVPGIAAAHPQHAPGEGSGLVHYLTDPFHLGLAVVATVLVVAARRLVLQRRVRHPNR